MISQPFLITKDPGIPLVSMTNFRLGELGPGHKAMLSVNSNKRPDLYFGLEYLMNIRGSRCEVCIAIKDDTLTVKIHTPCKLSRAYFDELERTLASVNFRPSGPRPTASPNYRPGRLEYFAALHVKRLTAADLHQEVFRGIVATSGVMWLVDAVSKKGLRAADAIEQFDSIDAKELPQPLFNNPRPKRTENRDGGNPVSRRGRGRRGAA